MTPDPNDTLTFIAVVEEGSFTAAARALRLPKTTVSRRVRELEARLGAQLLHRSTRRLSLTEAGMVYFDRCKGIAATLIEAEAAVGQLDGAPRGTLRVTSSHSLMVSLIAPLLGEFCARHPAVRLDLVLTHETLDLIEDKIDIALRMGPLPDSGMTARRLAVFPNHVYASEDYLARRGEPGHPRELHQHAALVTRVSECGRDYAWAMRRGNGAQEDYPVTPVIVADDPEALKPPLLAGAGLMMATDMIMWRHAEAGLVRPVLTDWVGRCPELHALFLYGRAEPPKLRAFIDFLVAKLDPKWSRSPSRFDSPPSGDSTAE